jgi:periplasmic protein TonB
MFGNWHLKQVILYMKPLLFSIFSLFLFINSFSQTNNIDTPNLLPPMSEKIESDRNTATEPANKIYDYVDEPASFPGGISALSKFIQSHFVYPEMAMENNVQGTCIVEFVVNNDGRVHNVKVVRGVVNGSECDMEALKIVRKMPNWIPAKKNAVPVSCYFRLPIKFVLVEDE